MTGVHAGWVSGRERIRIQGAEPVRQWGRPQRPKPMTHEREKPDPSIVPGKPANKAGKPVAEPVQGREGAQGEHGPAKHGRGERATGAGPCTRGRKRALLRQTPEAGARCVSSAGRDPCGGRGVTRVPTVIEFPCHRISWNLSRNSRSQSRRDSSRAMSWSSHCNR